MPKKNTSKPTKKNTAPKTPPVKDVPVAPNVDTVNDPEVGSSVRVRNSGL